MLPYPPRPGAAPGPPVAPQRAPPAGRSRRARPVWTVRCAAGARPRAGHDGRVGVAPALSNAVATLLFTGSYLSRAKGAHTQVKVLSALGLTMMSLGGN